MHTSPIDCTPFGFSSVVTRFAENDMNLIDDLVSERTKVKLIVHELIKYNTIEKFFYGHFHSSANFNYNNIETHLLNVNEIYLS